MHVHGSMHVSCMTSMETNSLSWNLSLGFGFLNISSYQYPHREKDHCPQGSRKEIVLCSSIELSSYVASSVLLSLSKIKSCALLHLCLAVNLSLQLEHSPCTWRRCISSHESRLMGVAGGVWVMVGCARLLVGDWNNFRCLDSCSSFIRARLIASFNVRGLNIRISSEISDFSPPIKVPTSAFCVHP